MFEWLSVQTTSFTNADGVITDVKLIHEFSVATQNFTVPTYGKDLDLIAFEQLQNEYESLQLLENNAQILMEYEFNMSNVPKLKIPVI